MNNYTMRILRAVAGAAVIVALVMTVNRWMGEYRTARESAPPAITTETPVPARDSKDSDKSSDKDAKNDSSKGAEQPKDKQKVVVLIDGLNFRQKPDSNAGSIRGLDKGTELTLVKKQDGWYQVQDSDGVKGWVSSKSTYTKLK